MIKSRTNVPVFLASRPISKATDCVGLFYWPDIPKLGCISCRIMHVIFHTKQMESFKIFCISFQNALCKKVIEHLHVGHFEHK